MDTIKSKQEFSTVFSSGCRYNGRLVRIAVLKGDEGDPSKVAFVAAKRLGTAVHRNRCKRVLREAARLCGLPRAGARVILFATDATADSHPADISHELTGLLRKSGI
ncbi:ribonuclease P protein component [Atopobium sp. oral taxon 810]|uniref:ribonuclease P protein component n=1 Tax=Atopobium sp. oral taxon 810 TaxID=712158 RepID=UPI0003986CB7|nr:ribonuclease P protein component [Atopobium sp. oral taxon 810]ERI06316.1 ribonuclease P protein component [Atopobium sp. oral taxon 810 str. F0209]